MRDIAIFRVCHIFHFDFTAIDPNRPAECFGSFLKLPKERGRVS